MAEMLAEFQQVRLFSIRGDLSIGEGVEEGLTTCFFSQETSIQFKKHRPVSLGVVSPLLSAYHARAISLKTHGFLSNTYLTLYPAERRDVMLFHVDSGLLLALLMTLNQTDLPPL